MNSNWVLGRFERFAHVFSGVVSISDTGFWSFRRLPHGSLRRTAARFQRQLGEVIVEIGTGAHGRLSGNSMAVWTRRTGAKRIVAVDLDHERLDEVRRLVGGHAGVELVHDDGLRYLARHEGPIHLLYLDFWVADRADEVPGTARASAYLEAYRAASDKLAPRSLILIDDTDHIPPWKHSLLIPEARKDGFEVIHVGRQTLLAREGATARSPRPHR